MLIPLNIPGGWEDENHKIHKSLKLSDSTSVKIHQGIVTALREAVLGLTHLYPHKMTLVFQPQVAYYVDDCVKSFARLGYKTLAWTGQELGSDTLAVLISDDHPVTGQIYELEDFVNWALSKKIYVIRLSHHLHFYRPRPEKISAYEIRIFSLDRQRALSMAGERAHFPAYFSPGLYFETNFSDPFNSRAENKSQVEELERNLPQGAMAFLRTQPKRIFDRALISWSDMDGLSVVTNLAENLGISDEPGQYLETLSLCRWKNPQVIYPYLPMGLSSDFLRGTIIVSSKLISPHLPKILVEVVEKIQRIQNGC